MKKFAKKFAVLAAVSALTLTACSSDSEAGGSEQGDTVAGVNSLSGISLTVGSKDFDEALVLGEMLVQAFGAAGAEVGNQVGLGGTSVARTALTSGEIDVYPEYNGTGWAVHLEQEDPSFDSVQLTADVKELDLEKNNIVWIGRSPFNNTYGFVSSPEVTEANGGPFTTQTFMEYVRDNPDATVCMETEYPDRPDGLILTEEATGIEMPDAQVSILDTGVIYTETANNVCTFGEVYTTDGRIPALDLTLVQDTGINIVYNVSATMRGETYDQAPDQFEAIVAAILEPLDNDVMAELNKRVSADGEEASAVAKDFLVTNGIIAG
jgi:osmoprotectant transport system substrate-binding protein